MAFCINYQVYLGLQLFWQRFNSVDDKKEICSNDGSTLNQIPSEV